MAKFPLLLLAWSGLSFAQDPSWSAVLTKLFGKDHWWPDLIDELIPADASTKPATTASSFSLKPTAGATWNIELINVPPISLADNTNYHIWDYDFSASEATIKAYKAKGHPVICYFSAGTWEKWRPDADTFPKDAIGKTDGPWPNEKWVNTNSPGIRAVMQKRIQDSAAKGCDGVDPDNVENWDVDTGFHLTQDDAVDYVEFLANAAHDAGMAFGLKNAAAIIPRVIDLSQWAVNEQCVQYDECQPYQAFIKQNKPVFHIEYTPRAPAPASFIQKSCNDPQANGFSSLIKHLNLSTWTTTCP